MSRSELSTSGHLTAARDRGPSPYFHGRKAIRRDFAELLKRSKDTNTGTTFLIQGASGAGKTALLYECQKYALEAGWNVALISPTALWDTNELLNALGKGRKMQLTRGSGKFGVNALIKIKAGVDFTLLEKDRTPLEILSGTKKPLLLILDEAQVLSTEGIPPTNHRSTATSLLTFIHNGNLGKPAILLVAGLGTTIASFGKLGISRFGRNCVVELGALSKESERLVIEDWIKKEGSGQGDSSAWLDAIAKETHGWPQHIQCYADLASKYLKANGGAMTPDGLNSVLETGHKARKVYYKQRVVDLFADQIQCLANSIPDQQSEQPAPRIEIMSALANKYGDSEAKDLFRRFVEKGILEERGMGFVVPIPSMHAWLKETYTRENIEIPPEPQKSRVDRDRDAGLGR